MDRTDASSPLDVFLWERIKDRPGRKLDYGCGNGRFLRFCEKRGLEVFGTDAFEYHYINWDQGNERVTRIDNDVAPYPDDYFSCIVANMVFEHVPSERVEAVAGEITRLLAPGGTGIFVFPTKRTLIEGHVGVPFAHWIDGNPRLLGKYLSASYRIGLGYWRSDRKRGGPPTVSREAWVSRFVTELTDTVHYSSRRRWAKAFTNSGCEVHNQSHWLMSFAASSQLTLILRSATRISIVRGFVNGAVEARLGVVLEVTK